MHYSIIKQHRPFFLHSLPALLLLLPLIGTGQTLQPVVPADKRGTLDAERMGTHDAANIRTMFYNFGMVGDYPPDPGNVDLSVFHSVEVPKGSGMDYSDGITPFVLAKVKQRDGTYAYIMETGYRERQGLSPYHNRVMRFEPRPGYFQNDPAINKGRSPAISNDPRTWPDSWPDKAGDPSDPGWAGSWDGYFGKRPAADQESYTVMDDNFYDAWDFNPDSRDSTRRGLGLRVEVRGFQWANPQASNVIFWHYDITNEGTTDYDNNIIFGLYMDSGVGGSGLSCDGLYESDDDNAYFDKSSGLNLVYTWDRYGHGVDLTSNCAPTGYLGYAYLETPGNSYDGIDNDNDGITDESRSSGPGQLIVGQQAIRDYVTTHYNMQKFEAYYGPLEQRPAYRAGRWWTGDEDMDWVAELDDVGADGIPGTHDLGEGDGIPTDGEPNFDRTDKDESDQIGLTGFKMNRIKAGPGNPNTDVDNLVFFDDGKGWPKRLFDKFSDPNPAARFDSAVALNYNIAFLFASGPFQLPAGSNERFSLALAYGADLEELRSNVKTVQKIYNANYQFAVPPPMPVLTAETGDHYVHLSWTDVSERGLNPVTGINDFEGYRIYRSTDPEFQDPRVVTDARGNGPLGNGKPLAQFDLVDGIQGYSKQVVSGVAYWLGSETGLTHNFIDTTVTDGQQYYYAVTAYNYGSDSLGFYPSENAIAVSRTPRGGVILPLNVVSVRPNLKADGFTPASSSSAVHSAGNGTGTVNVRVVNSTLVPDHHVFKVIFNAPSVDTIRATGFDLIDSTTGKTIFTNGYDLSGTGNGQVGDGLLVIANTPNTVIVDSANTGFTATSHTNVKLSVAYEYLLSINQRRPGFPGSLEITFSNVPIDTSMSGFGPTVRSIPVKFRVVTHTDSGDVHMKCFFRHLGNDSTLSRPYPDEYIDAVTYLPGFPNTSYVTWRITLDTSGRAPGDTMRLPTSGDIYTYTVLKPFGASDVFTFTSTAEHLDPAKARQDFSHEPYVVPNPYVGSASFEPQRFAVSGRGDRRLEFRSLPAKCTIRIYTVTGKLVQTLVHDGSNEGYISWDLRTKDDLDVAPGLYIFHVDGGALGTHIGKFAIIK